MSNFSDVFTIAHEQTSRKIRPDDNPQSLANQLARSGCYWQAVAMHERQLLLWDANDLGESNETADSITPFVSEAHDEIRDLLFAPLKRIQLVHEGDVSTRPMIGSVDDAIGLFRDYWRQYPGNDQERFVVACLNTKKRVLSIVPVTVGTLDASLVHPREVFRPAIVQSASAVILSHNHPSGDPTPSREDRDVTRRLMTCGEFLGIEVLDHIIHGDGTCRLTSLQRD